jgi:hypothetical protein
MRRRAQRYFLIWNATERIIRIFAFQVNDQLCEFVIVTEKVHRILCNESASENGQRDDSNLPKAFHPIMAEKSR